MPTVNRVIGVFALLLPLALATAQPAQQSDPVPKPVSRATLTAIRSAAHRALADRQGAIVLLDVDTLKVLASERPEIAARRLAAPGSTVKPFVLRELIVSGKLRPDESITCRRTVRLGQRNFDCVHAPVPEPMAAATALAYSCNFYFAEVADRLSPEELHTALRRAGFGSPLRIADDQAIGSLVRAVTPEEVRLQALGEFGVTTNALELANAYALLARAASEPRARLHVAAVSDGLTASTEYGMAHLARTGTMRIAGKTGTARAAEGAWTHGWFAGFAPAENPKLVVVVFLERGQGRDAAAIAGEVFASYESALKSQQRVEQTSRHERTRGAR